MIDQSSTGFILYCLFTLLYFALIVLLYSKRKHFGYKWDTRMLALGISCVFYKTGALAFFIDTPQLLVYGLNLTYINYKGGLTGDLNKFDYSNSYDIFTSIPVIAVILFIALWLGVGKILDSFRYEKTESTAVINPNLRSNMILILLLLFSIYLCLAAIISVPWLKNNNTNITDGEKILQEKLDLVKSNYSNGIPPLNSNLDELNINLLDTLPFYFKEDVRELVKNQVNEIKTNYQKTKDSRLAVTGNYNSLYSTFDQTSKSIYDGALSQFTNELPRMNSIEANDYIARLSNWYRAVLSNIINSANFIDDQIISGDKINNEQIRNFDTYWFLKMKTNLGNLDYESLNLYISEYRNDFTIPNDYPIPERPDSSISLGIFQSVAKFIIDTRLLSVALIIGMIGFGMFGAIISTYVKENKINNESLTSINFLDKAIIEDLPGVVLKGISAAVIIFLAVLGGLSVFSSAEADPNPYILFFTCMVGAVYSEQIWAWAQKFLGDKFSTNTDVPPPPLEEEEEEEKKVDEVKPPGE